MGNKEEVNEIFDIAVVGCGPAGLSAAINAANRKKKVAIFGTEFCSPKLHRAPSVENYLGLPNMTGEEMRKRFLGHLEVMKLVVNKNKITGVYPQDDGFALQAKDKFFNAKSVVIATGVSTIKPIDQEVDYLGRGVSYCATCDGPLYKGKKVIVLAYNKEGLEESNYLAELAAEVIVVPVLSDKDAQGVNLDPKIKIVKGKPKGIIGEMWATGVALEDQNLTADGIFIIRDSVLPDQLVPGLEIRDQGINVDRNGRTNIPGVFAAGDCTGAPYQLSKAAGEGQVAALTAVKYVDEMKNKAKEPEKEVALV